MTCPDCGGSGSEWKETAVWSTTQGRWMQGLEPSTCMKCYGIGRR